MTRPRTGWLGAIGQLVGVGASVRQPPMGQTQTPPQNLAQPQHGFSAANPGPAWTTWDSYPTYIKTETQAVAPYTAACGQWSAPLGKGEIDGFLYSTAVMLVEYANGQPVTQQTRTGLYLFALENEMVTVRKCLAQNVPIQQAKFSALRGAPGLAGVGALDAYLGGWLAGMPVGLGGCGPGCDSCPFCKQATHAFGGRVVGIGDSCGHTHPCVELPDPPAFPTGEPCGGPPIPMHYMHDQGRGAAFTGLGAPAPGLGTRCGDCVDLPDPPAFPQGEPCGGPPIPLHYLRQQPVADAFRGVGAVSPRTPPAYVPVSPGGSAPLPGAPVSTAGGFGGATPPWAFQRAVQPGQTPDGFVTPLTYVDVAQQMPLRPPGKMAYQPTLPWWTAWHKDEQHGFNCWWANQQFAQPVCGLGHVANFPATPDFDQLRWVLRMGIPFSPELRGALAGCPKADAMLRQVDPYGLAQRDGDGSLGFLPSKGVHGKPLEALAVLAAAAGVSLATVLGLKAVRR
jgi:hypothetical protein